MLCFPESKPMGLYVVQGVLIQKIFFVCYGKWGLKLRKHSFHFFNRSLYISCDTTRQVFLWSLAYNSYDREHSAGRFVCKWEKIVLYLEDCAWFRIFFLALMEICYNIFLSSVINNHSNYDKYLLHV